MIIPYNETYDFKNENESKKETKDNFDLFIPIAIDNNDYEIIQDFPRIDLLQLNDFSAKENPLVNEKNTEDNPKSINIELNKDLNIIPNFQVQDEIETPNKKNANENSLSELSALSPLCGASLNICFNIEKPNCELVNKKNCYIRKESIFQINENSFPPMDEICSNNLKHSVVYTFENDINKTENNREDRSDINAYKKLRSKSVVLVPHKAQRKDLNGYKIMKYTNGDKYEGNFVKSKREGQGTYTYRSGNIFKGQWKNDYKHGQGYYKFYSGEYIGGWIKDLKSGYGVFTKNNKDKYEGEFARGLMHGIGIYYSKNGDVLNGEWKNGKKNGHFTCYHKDNNTTTIEIWKEGVRTYTNFK